MASGDIAQVDAGSLPVGTVVTSSGRVSAALWPRDGFGTPPFSRDDLILLDDTLKETSEVALVRFSVFIGDLGTDVIGGARAALAEAPEPYNGALIAVSPNTRDVAVVSGSDVAGRVNDRVAELGVQAALSGFKQGDLIDGLVSALRVMATAVARP
ncbi:DUF5130 domain-containing protein [Gordonia sp. HY002]|uniref:DUF5130 family protein n=1 Tax=Gordonia zhenghanii TaxID=2911516 RepID=UPI001EF0F82B|nr:DUF5130 family protein [Gordonia zhenghanii]MCF8569478.1 DUF5130 domain-containing protein [Gordonia zhenghanii]MCF8602351.1 DUF5130 domain-containing protein [Gordonia zhenghanii]